MAKIEFLVFANHAESKTGCSNPSTWSLLGSEHREVPAVNADLVLSIPGGYRVVAELDDDRRSVGFRVHDMLEADSAAS